MNLDVQTRLDDLQQRIEKIDISIEAKGVSVWKGADVTIALRSSPELRKWVGNQPMVISFQSSEPRRRLVITKYALELSWLFSIPSPK